MLVAGILNGPDGRAYGTTNQAKGAVHIATNCSMCIASLLNGCEFDEAVLVRVFPWSKREAALDLMPDSMSKAIMTAIERSHHVSKDSL